jgi:pyruvate,water dikinase
MLLKNLFRYWTYQIFSPGTVLREKYEAFKSLLTHDKDAHEIMAELEEIYYNQERVDFQLITDKYNRLSESVVGIIDDLAKMCPSRYLDLRAYYKKFDSYIRFILAPPDYDSSPPYTFLLNEISADGQAMVGGKAYNLSTIATNLHLPIPAGFAITTHAFYYFIESNDLRTRIDEELAGIDINSASSLDRVSHKIVDWIMTATIPPDVEAAIVAAYQTCPWHNSNDLRVAMRSSAIAEDGRSSFAGQYHTELNVKMPGIIDAYKKVIASKYASRALFYRINYGLSDGETPMAVLVLEMIDAEASGVMYTQTPDNPQSDRMDIHAIWGLGELLVGGEVSSDVIRMTRADPAALLDQHIGEKYSRMIYSPPDGTVVVPVTEDKKRVLCLDEKGALKLAEWGMKLESYYNKPQDVEWCRDNRGSLFILQSRPLQIDKKAILPVECNFDEIEKTMLLTKGDKAAAGIGAGPVYKINRNADLQTLPCGSVLVAKNALPHYVKVLNKVNAVVTDTGSAAGHFASVAREFGIPVLVNTGVATTRLAHGQEVTVYADEKTVYDGIVHPMVESPCARKDLLVDSPFMRKMKYIMSFISSLRLVDPDNKNFKPEGCRSLHDIIRFSHEKAVSEMFSMGDRRFTRKQGTRKLVSAIPVQVYVLDVGDGITEKPVDPKTVRIEEVKSIPLKAVWKGLNHPGIHWSDFGHFDWAEYDKIVMSGGIISADSALLSSYAVLSRYYLNLALKFGYHFVILDTICGDRSDENYALFRFTGGGADYAGRSLRADFLRKVLDRIGFDVEVKKSDLINARLDGDERPDMEKKLDMLGRLLGATRLMDMYLKDESQIDGFVTDFMEGRYHFATVS